MTTILPRHPSAWLAAALLAAAGLSSTSRAQTDIVVPASTPTTVVPPDGSTSTTRVNPDGSTTTTTTTTTQPAAPAVPPVPAPPAEVLAPGEHIVDIELAVSRGSVQAYFGRAAKREGVAIGDLHLSVKVPSTASVTKLLSRDKDSEGSTRVTRDNPWNARVKFTGPGRYVFNIVEWDNDPVVTAAVVRVDGQVVFSGRGSEDNINGWAETHFAPGVSKSGSREIAFVVD